MQPSKAQLAVRCQTVEQLGELTHSIKFEAPDEVPQGLPLVVKCEVTNTSNSDWPVLIDSEPVLKVGGELYKGLEKIKIDAVRVPIDQPIFRSGETLTFEMSFLNTRAALGQCEVMIDLVYDYVAWFAHRGAVPVRFGINVQPTLFFPQIDESCKIESVRFWQQHVPEFSEHSEIGLTSPEFQTYVAERSNGPITVRSMLTTYELGVLYAVARYYVKGIGAIADLGPLLGVGTYAMARGLSLNKMQPQTRIYSYDLFLMEHMYHFLPDGDCQNTGSVFKRFLDINRDYLDTIVPVPGDFLNVHWNREPIEVLFIDLAKSWDLNQHLLREFFPYLIPGHSIVIQQDYVHCGEPWVALTMEYFSEYFEFLYFIFGATAVYRLIKPIPSDVLQTNIKEWPLKQIDALFLSARNKAPHAVAEILKCCQAVIHVERKDISGARELLESVDITAKDPVDISQDFSPMICPNLDVVRRWMRRRRIA